MTTPVDNSNLRDFTLADTDMKSGLWKVYLVCSHDGTLVFVHDTVYQDEQDAHESAQEASATDEGSTYWVETVILRGPALDLPEMA